MSMTASTGSTVPLHPARGRSPALNGDERRRVEEVRRRELAAFLRSRRERVTPEQVGLVAIGRRRTPGLRREEVARLAGVGVTWYTWLEQARDIRVSTQVLDAVSRTLQLDPHERTHLFMLAGASDEPRGRDCAALPPSVQALLDRLDPFPAVVQNARYDLLAYNRTYGGLFDDLDAMEREDRNALWLLFTHPAWRRAMPDWEDAAPRMVAQYRAAMAEHVAEPAWKCQVSRLRAASPEFAALWDRHDVQAPENHTKRILQRRVGLLRLDHTYLWLGQRLGTRMATYTPADDETRERLDRLAELLRGGRGIQRGTSRV